MIPDKAAFVKRLENYAANGAPVWVAGRSQLSDDIDHQSMIKAITVSSKKNNGEEKANRASKFQDTNPELYNYFTDNILFSDNSFWYICVYCPSLLQFGCFPAVSWDWCACIPDMEMVRYVGQKCPQFLSRCGLGGACIVTFVESIVKRFRG